jgi:3-hydroxyisobutyrate dehydrogenase-like beta-hydroxyacid dehydrogenase
LTSPEVGFIGLGNMGHALATNLVAAGHALVTHDIAGSHRNPDGAVFADDVSGVAARTEIVVLSLPDGAASERVCRELSSAADSMVRYVIDTSTIGLEAARTIDELLSNAGITYVDAPVSGGVAGARARSLAVIVAGDASACEAVETVLAGLSDCRFHVGERPGMGQALKLANNFLSATALVATSEAIAFGTAVGLDMATMLDVLNTSSGRSAATSDKFANHVVNDRYASGFANTLMAKDVQLYLGAATAQGAPCAVGRVTSELWRRFAEAEPDVDFTRVYPFIRGGLLAGGDAAVDRDDRAGDVRRGP